MVGQTKQEHDGAVDLNTPSVIYAYDDGASGGEAKFVRLASVTYPDGREVHYNIPTSGVGQKLARVDNIADDASGTNKYAQYQYVGSSMIVSISHPEVTGGLNLSYGASGAYAGWDRFGRIVDQLWTDDSAATIDEIQHSYDRGSNRITRANGLNAALSEVYTYDGLDRLVDTNRNGANLQDWSLDALGNWREFTDGATTQTRTNNAANEITGIAGVGWIAPAYDAAGNMTSGPKPGDEATRLHFTYDAWNRLAEVKDDNAGVPGTTIADYEYDGRNYRIEKLVGADTSDVYYNEAWQALEVRHNGDTDPLEQNVWDLRYVDAPVVRFLDANTDGDYADATDSTLYYVQDANFNVTALVDAATGEVVERYSYDPYGKATVYDANWTVRSAGTAYANELQYAGYRLDAETGLYQVRNRYYHTALATWISRDHLRYAPGDFNLYRYVSSNPLLNIDPLGTVKVVGSCCDAGKLATLRKSLASAENAAKRAAREAQSLLDELNSKAATGRGLNLSSPSSYEFTDPRLNALRIAIDKWFSTPVGKPTPGGFRHYGVITWNGLHTVVENLKKVADSFKNPVYVDCESSCEDRMVAYVRSGIVTGTLGMNSTIHICPLYWKKDSRTQAGRLLHELSHIYADTEDYAYLGARGSGGYAAQYQDDVLLNESQLVGNADTYEGFFESIYLAS